MAQDGRGSFDLIVAIESLEHSSDVPGTLRLFGSALAPSSLQPLGPSEGRGQLNSVETELSLGGALIVVGDILEESSRVRKKSHAEVKVA